MKYLRKFATQSDYDAYVESGMETPNVSLVAESYTTFFTKKEIEIPLGVFIQHINGKLYTADEWTAKGFSNDEANGVAVSAEECAFVIAKKEVANYIPWSSNDQDAIQGVMLTSDESVAKSDYNGENNTKLILATDTSGAAYSCANYTFPNGKKGYLPALGEWAVAFAHKSAIDHLMSLIGGSGTTSGISWSSTQKSGLSAWLLRWSYGNTLSGLKNNLYTARPFTTL